MARICVNGKWYEQLDPASFSEAEFEYRITLHAASVYPYYYVIPFKKPLKSPDESEKGYSTVIADLIFVSKTYQDWWVVEVEMSDHPLNTHVKPQVEKLLCSDYDEDVIEYICDKEPAIQTDQLRYLIKTSPVKVLLIVNQYTKGWQDAFESAEVVIAVFELYRAEDNHEIFRVDGQYPTFMVDKISTCKFHPYVPRLISVDDPLKLDYASGRVKLLYNGYMTEWRVIIESEQVWLTSVNRNPLQSNKSYEICRQSDGQLVLCIVSNTNMEDR